MPKKRKTFDDAVKKQFGIGFSGKEEKAEFVRKQREDMRKGLGIIQERMRKRRKKQ